nr:Polyamine transporter 4-like protein 3 [Colletotrichum truncatum]KAF6797389.1 Polyamine transporter 4-like protein 3 [Colletotrichum truncatum]
MYEKLGVHWAGSVFAFLSLLLLPIPWLLFKFGPALRKRSKFATSS